jgi:hypothetical protein
MVSYANAVYVSCYFCDMLFNAHLCMDIILRRTGGAAWVTALHTVRGVGGLGIRMLTLDTKTSLYCFVVTSGLTSADIRLTSGLRSTDEADEAAGSITRLRFVRFFSNFVHLPPRKPLENRVCHAPLLTAIKLHIFNKTSIWR